MGCEGWSWPEVFPYFLKSEDMRDPILAKTGYHGTGGPLTVSTAKQISPIAHAFVEAGKSLGESSGYDEPLKPCVNLLFQTGYPNTDVNGRTQTGFTIPSSTIRRGARCSTAKAFLYDIRDRPNLHVVTFAFVTRVLFNKHKHATHVQFDRFGLTHVVHARKEIVLSAGSVNSPQLLMLSGETFDAIFWPLI